MNGNYNNPQQPPVVTNTPRKFCQVCGTPVEPGTVFCSRCGAQVGEATPPAAPAAPYIPQPPMQAPGMPYGVQPPMAPVQAPGMPYATVQPTAPAKKKKSPAKIVISIIAIVLGAVILIFGVLFASTFMKSDSDIVGEWESNEVYLSKYKCDCIMELYFYDDNSMLAVLRKASNGNILNIEVREWEIKGNEVVSWELDDTSSKVNYAIQIGGTLENGIYVYEKTSSVPDLD